MFHAIKCLYSEENSGIITEEHFQIKNLNLKNEKRHTPIFISKTKKKIEFY